MTAVIAIGWALWLIVAIALVLEFVGMRRLVQMFPEGRRAWMTPVQLLTLAHFAAVVLLNPWR